MAFIIPIVIFYSLLLISLVAGLVAWIGIFIRRQRHPWILVVALVAIVLGSWVGSQVLQSTGHRLHWFTVVGLAPIVLGSASVVRWFFLKPRR